MTLLELLLIMALVSVLAAITLTFWRPNGAMLAAAEVRTTLLWARANALWRGVPVSVTQEGDAELLIRQTDPAHAPCEGGVEIERLDIGSHPGVRLVAGLPRGLLWLPDGSGRTCSGGGVISATLKLQGSRGGANVIVSSLGRVRVEPRPLGGGVP